MKIVMTLLLGSMMAAGLSAAAQDQSQGQSLADLARQQRAKKEQEQGKQIKTYTNSDVPSSGVSEVPATGAAAQATPSPSTSAPPKENASQASQGSKESQASQSASPKTPEKVSGKGQDKSEADPEKQQAALEKTYRDRYSDLKQKLDFEEQKLDVMQRELNLAQMQYYSDPNVALREETFRTDINKRTEDIEKQKEQVEKAKQAVADFQDELREKNLPPGRGREDQEQQQQPQ